MVSYEIRIQCRGRGNRIDAEGMQKTRKSTNNEHGTLQTGNFKNNKLVTIKMDKLFK